MSALATPSRSVLKSSEMRSIPDETRDLVSALQNVVEGEVRFDGYTRMLYSTDASLYQIQPIGVVIPRHDDDVQATVELAAKFKTPILPRGVAVRWLGRPSARPSSSILANI